jgi:hypothetical protein
MKTLNRISLWLLLICSAYGVWAFTRGPKIEYVTRTVTEQIDEDLWVRRSEYVSQRAIADSARALNDRLASELRSARQEITSLVTIAAELKIEVDSLSTLELPQVTSDVDIDTSLVNLYTDSLFQVTTRFKADSTGAVLSQDLTQLRPIRFSVVSTVANDQVYFYVTSPDFKMVNIETAVTLPPKKDRRLHYAIAGLITGVVGWELIR